MKLMNLIWKLFSQVSLGFWLLFAVSINSFIGALIVDFHHDEFIRLNFIRLPQWLSKNYHHPFLYLWICVLFIFFFMLALNTVVCTWLYIQKTTRWNLAARRLSIILFHISFLIFLCGHFFFEFTGTSQVIVLQEGSHIRNLASGLSLELVLVEKKFISINGKKTLLSAKTDIQTKNRAGKTIPVCLENMKPKLVSNHSLHLAMKDDDLTEKQVRIIVRENYGLYAFFFGWIVTFAAVLLYSISLIYHQKNVIASSCRLQLLCI